MNDEQKTVIAKTEATKPTRPTVGRIVHYQAYGTPGGEFPKTARAAVVTEIDIIDPLVNPDGTKVGLCVLNPQGFFFNQHVRYDGSADPKGGTWCWPPRA